MEKISLKRIFEEVSKQETIVEKKEDKKSEKTPVYDSPIYNELENSILTWAQIADKMPEYSGKNASDRSLFGKKARRQTIDGYRYGFTQKELEHIKTALSTIG